ncbi:CoA-binding protein [Tissierella sp. Yu-01]|uniref:CoA-binding protein n=1 Tax=Tissierella sp. Yu-01 TaxID=3035694 RepID=UPI00240D9E97|nr:CoA-binding protein [Tissierella sp. Yu-01]WFA09609.1 CoA-binding protein [Tissierella sp. Yu-01]
MNVKEVMLDKKVWAVVGVSAKKNKWGYKIFKILKDHNYETYGISPNYDDIEGDKIYHSLKDLPKKVDVIDMVVSPKIAMNTLEEAKELGIEYIFFQPGTYDDEVIAKAEELGLKYLTGDCIYAILRNK